MIDPNSIPGAGLDSAFVVVVVLILLALAVHYFRRRSDRRAGIQHKGNPWKGPYAPPDPPPITYQHRDKSAGG
jgi:hypothetical protein